MIRTASIALAIIALAFVGQPLEAAEIATGPVRLATGDVIDCIAANVGTAALKNVTIVLQFNKNDGSSNGSENTTCPAMAPGQTCVKHTTGDVDDFSVFCTVVFAGGKAKGALCNQTQGLCADASR
jgi:hypothetical protein